MRPVGGIFFGHIGDKLGRKKALLLSIVLVTLPTVCIGLLPTYHQIGIAAPIILILCRVIQGFCVGGEYTGATVYIFEHTKQGRSGLAAGILMSMGFVGTVLATGMGALCTLPFVPSWGWRVPFLLGGVIGGCIYLLRQKLEETSSFKQIEQKVSKLPLFTVMKSHPRNVFCVGLIGASLPTGLYISTIYMNSVLKNSLSFSTSESMILNTCIMFIWVLILPVMGHFSDKIGKAKMMSIGCIGFIITAYPLFYLMDHMLTIWSILLFQVVFAFVGAAYGAPSSGLLPEYFPVAARYSGIAFGLTVGQAFLGGWSPVIATKLVSWTGSFISPAFYIMAAGGMGWLALKYAKPLVTTPPTGLESENNTTSSPRLRVIQELS